MSQTKTLNFLLIPSSQYSSACIYGQLVFLGWFLNTFGSIFTLRIQRVGFLQLFQVCFHITQGHIPPQIARILGAAHHLTMIKSLGGIRPIAMGEAIYRFTNHTLCFQFHETFVTHFCPHQFGVTTKCGCETVIHNIKCTLDLHLDWVILQLDMANTFNFVFRRVIYQKLYARDGDII